MTLLLGVAKVNITPRRPIPLAGFAHRSGDYEGIRHPLYARIFWFQWDEDGESHRSLLISADLICFGNDNTQAIRRRLQDTYGLAPSSVFLHATHTHSGPLTSANFTSILGYPDTSYLEQLEHSLLEGVKLASEALVHVRAEVGYGICGIGIHRRKRVDDQVVMAPNEHGPVDKEVSVYRFRDNDGNVKALLVHYTCHPTTSGDNSISSEYCGVAMHILENYYGGGCISGFLQGCCGDVRPALIKDDQFYRGGQEEIEQFGTMLAQECINVVSAPMEALQPVPIVSDSAYVSLPFQQLPTAAEIEETRLVPGIEGFWSQKLLEEPGLLKPNILLELTKIRIFDGLALLGMNGEIVVEYGLWLKEAFGRTVLPVAYTNGMIAYVPTARQIEDGGYESVRSTKYFALPAAFSPEIEGIIHNGVTEFLRQGFRNP